MQPTMRQVPSRLRILCLMGSLPFHEAHTIRLGEEKAKCNLENSLAGFQAGSTSAIATCGDTEKSTTEVQKSLVPSVLMFVLQ